MIGIFSSTIVRDETGCTTPNFENLSTQVRDNFCRWRKYQYAAFREHMMKWVRLQAFVSVDAYHILI